MKGQCKERKKREGMGMKGIENEENEREGKEWEGRE